MQYLRQSTSISVVIGPIWATADGALKADLAYDAAGINCDIYKNGTKADITLANSAGDGYFRAASGEALYLLTLSTGHTDTIGRALVSLSATGYYMKPVEFVVLDEAVYDVLFGTTAPSTLAAGALMGLVDDAITAGKFDESTAFPLKSVDTGATAVARTGADSDTLETLSDEIAAVKSDSAAILTDTGSTLDTLIKDIPTNAELATALAGADDAVLAELANATYGLSAIETLVDGLESTIGVAGAGLTALATQTSVNVIDDLLDTEIAALITELAKVPKSDGTASWNATALAAINAEVDAAIADADFATDADVAAAVRDVDNTTPAADSLGEAINSAASVGDPWATTLPGSYGAGTAGLLVGTTIPSAIDAVDNMLDAEIPAITAAVITNAAGADIAADIIALKAETAAILEDTGTTLDGKINTIDDFLDTEIAAIKAKTDNLPASPAAVGSNMGTVSSVTGNVGGNVVGSVGSVVTKTGYELTSAYDAAKTAASQTSVNDLPTNSELATALASADDAVLSAISALNDFDPVNDVVAHVTLVDTTTTNTDMISAAPSAASIADAVWDEASTGHTEAGKAGAQMWTDVDAILADTNELQTNQGNWATATGFSTHDASDVVTAIGTGSTLSAIPWNAAWDAEVQSECADALIAYDPPTNAEMEARTLVAADYVVTTDTIAGVTTVGSVTSKTGYELTAAYDAAKTAASQTSVNDLPTNSELATALAGADDAVLAAIASLKDFDPSNDTVAHVTLVDRVGGFVAGAIDNAAFHEDVATMNEVAQEAADEVRTELAAELAYLDAAVSTRSTLTAQQVWEYATRTLSAFGFSVTASSVTDKTGYSLTADYDAAKTAGTSTLTAQQVWEYATRTLSAFGFNVTVETNNDKTGYSLVAAYDPAKTTEQATEVSSIKGVVDKLDTAMVQDGLVYKFTENALEEVAVDISGLSTFDPTTDTVDIGKVNGVAVTNIDDFKANIDDIPTNLELESALTSALNSDPSLAFILSWINNRLARTDNHDGTITYELYNDSDDTVILSWIYTTETGTRSKAE